MSKHPAKHGDGDRNDNKVAWKDSEVQRDRDHENRHNDEERDRADEAHTGNHEPPSKGPPIP